MTDRLRETDALPLSDDELAFVRRHEATVCCCERTANHVSPEQAVKWGEPGRIDEARWLATVDDRDSEIRLAAAAYTEQQRELMDAYDDFGIVRRERDALESERDAYRKEVERQGKALRAVEALCDAAEAEEECGAYVFTDDIREAIALALERRRGMTLGKHRPAKGPGSTMKAGAVLTERLRDSALGFSGSHRALLLSAADALSLRKPSPSNEVNDEMVDAVIIGLGLEEDIGDALAREDVKRVLELMFGWFANAMEAGRMQEAARHR